MMRHFLRIMRAEARKQHRVYFHSATVYVTMGMWPVLRFLTAVYMFKPFTAGGANSALLARHLGSASLEGFLLIGYVGYNFFYSLIQSAWRFRFERFDGTLELIFLSPASRFAVIVGNALATLLESMWLLSAFAVLAYAWFFRAQGASIDGVALLVGITVMVVAAVAWGTLLNSLFLLSRDPGFFYTVLQQPLHFFGGVRFPVALFSSWMQAISYALPLTYCLIVLREVVLTGARLPAIWPRLLPLVGLATAMFVASYWLLGVAERRAKRTGAFTLF